MSRVLEHGGRRCGVRWFLFAGLALLLAGCGRFTDTVSLPEEHDEVALYAGRTVGQTFTCHHAGLTAIGVWFRAPEGGGEIVLRLRESAESTSDLATVTLSPPPGDTPAYHEFVVPLQDDVNGKSFYLLLEAPQAMADAPVVVPYSSDAVVQEELSLDGTALPGQLAFQLHYNSLYIVKDLVRQASAYGLQWLWLAFLSVPFYLLPGGAAVVWLLREGDWVEQVIVALGLSVAIYALLMYATMTGLRLGRGATFGFMALCAGLIGLRGWLDWRGGKRWRVPSARAIWASVKADPSVATLALVFALVLGVRVWVVRDLVAPMWGDGYHHTMISQLMVDNGGLFDSWEPYVPLTTFTYHFGFHANVALFHWFSGDTVIHSVIWVGQILNALAVLALYPLAVRVSGGSRWAGVGAVLVAGLLSPMPMYYVNWGRYTQLAGQVILPALMWLTWQAGEKSGWDWRSISLTVVALVGLGVVHYRVVLIYGVFVVAWGIVWLFRKWGRWRQVGQVVLCLSLAGILALVFFVPWGAHTFQARIPTIGGEMIRRGNQTDFLRGEYNAIGDIFSYIDRGGMVLAVAATIGLALGKRYAGWVMLLWIAGLLILANPYLFGLPGTGLVNNFAVFLMFYIPIGVLAGVAVGLACSWSWQRPWFASALAVIVALGAGWGILHRIRDLSIENALVTESDMNAMEWIREHTSPDARFLVNGFIAYGGTSLVGSDAGWWIPLLTGRANTIPPMVHRSEASLDPTYRDRVQDDFLYLQEHPPTTPEGIRFLQERNVTYAYVGYGAGKVGNPGVPLLSASALQDHPAYLPVYSQGGTWIFELQAPVE